MARKSEKNGKPRLKKRYNRIIRVVDQAIVLARLDVLKVALIYEARMESWTAASMQGLHDPIPFSLNIAELARKYRCDRKGLSRQFNSLVTSRVFIEASDNLFIINKIPSSWLNEKTGKPLFDAEQLRILDALDEESGNYRSGVYAPQDRGLHTPSHGDSTPQRVGTAHPMSGDCSPQGEGSTVPGALDSTPQRVRLQSPPQTSPPIPPVERARQRELIESKRESKESTRAHEREDDEEPFNAPVHLETKSDAPKVNNDSEEVTKVAAFADQCFPMSDFGIKVRSYASLYPIAWIKEGIQAAFNRNVGNWSYVMKVVQGIEDRGGIQKPAFAAGPKPSSGPTPIPPVVSYPKKVPPGKAGQPRQQPRDSQGGEIERS